MVEVDHRVNSLLLHWVVVSEHHLKVERLGELSFGLIFIDFGDVLLKLFLVEFTKSPLVYSKRWGYLILCLDSFINFISQDTNKNGILTSKPNGLS